MAEDNDSQKARMLAGRLYYAVKDPTLEADRNTARALCDEYNATRGSLPVFRGCWIQVVSP